MPSVSRRSSHFLLLCLCLICHVVGGARQLDREDFSEPLKPIASAIGSHDDPGSVSEHLDQIFRGQRIRGPALEGASRHPNDYELADLVLVTTVADGAVHALRRATGQRLWTLHDTDPERARTILGPLVRSSAGLLTAPANRNNASASELAQPLDLPEESYIVEPGTGSIFLHLRSTGRMQRLPLSVANLVDSSPFTFADDGSRMFVGRKTTQLVGVDLTSGKVVGLFGPEAGWCEWKTQPGMTGASAECEDAIDQRPQDLLYLGRTEYQLSVYEKSKGELIQHLAYTSYHPSAITASDAPWSNSPDDRYIQSLHNGELVCLRSAKVGWEWHSRELQSPVADIFDIAMVAAQGAQPVLFPHPIPRPSEEVEQSLRLQDLTYVGRTGDTLFAMSRKQYPFVGIRAPRHGSQVEGEAGDPLLGLHDVVASTPRRRQQPDSVLGIDGTNGLPQAQLPSAPDRPTLPPADSPDTFVWRLTVAILMMALLAFFWSKWRISRPSNGVKDKLERPMGASSDVSEASQEAITPTDEVPMHAVAVTTYDKDLPPLPDLVPTAAVQEAAKGIEPSEDDSTDAEGKENLHKRKKRRGKRGKRPGQKAAAALLAASGIHDPSIVVDSALETAAEEGQVRVGSLVISDQILGIGSHGTVVLRGEFQGRAVAVKRMLKQLITIASHEVALLQETDEHANVIRYFCKEQRDNFLYIALELCPRSLADLIERESSCEPEIVAAFDPKQSLRQISSGLAHLHRLKIVHRDIKPPNIMIAQRKAPDGSLRMLISDFGLCKRLDGDASSFHQTLSYDAAGSVGWRAPEVLRGDVDPNQDEGSSSNGLMPSGSSSNLAAAVPRKRLTRAIDIFSLGCLAYYVLSHGEHPFGGRYERESNILKSQFSLSKLDNLGEEAAEAQAMIEMMIAARSDDRPSADIVLQHPFFWSSTRRLHFICDASDRFETMERDPPDPVLQAVEHLAADVVGADWLKRLDRALIENLGKYRKYDGASVRDLLRVIRNKKNHFQDLPDNVKRSLGTPPEAFLSYFTQRFPRLFLHIWRVVQTELSTDELFTTYFSSEL